MSCQRCGAPAGIICIDCNGIVSPAPLSGAEPRLRRLVEQWRERGQIYFEESQWRVSVEIELCADELSALLDGITRTTNDETKG